MTLNPQNLALNFHFWECPRCSFHNSNRVTTCKTCSSDRDGPTGAAEQLPLDQVILRNNLRILKYNFIILLYHVLYIDLCLPLSNMSPSLFSLLWLYIQVQTTSWHCVQCTFLNSHYSDPDSTDHLVCEICGGSSPLSAVVTQKTEEEPPETEAHTNTAASTVFLRGVEYHKSPPGLVTDKAVGYSVEGGLTHCSEPSRDATQRGCIHVGSVVLVVQKRDQATGRLTRGTVARLLTASERHPRGIKVQLQSGEVGRAHRLLWCRPLHSLWRMYCSCYIFVLKKLQYYI